MFEQVKDHFDRNFPRISISIRNFFRRLYGRPLLSRFDQPIVPGTRKEIPANIRVDQALTQEFLNQLQLCDPDGPTVSIIIVSYDRADLVENLIKSIWLFTDTYRYEIIVVENGSTPGKHELAREIELRVRVVRLPERQYLGDAYNLGVDQAKGEFVVLLNNDIVVHRGWLSALIGELERNPTIGVVGPKFLFPTGELQEAGASFYPDGRALRRGRGKKVNDPAFNRKEEVAYCSGAALALRRALFLELGGYDRIWSPGYYEDADLCFKARARGLKVIYVPSAEVIHIENATMAEYPPAPDMTAIIGRNRKQFVSKWKDALERLNRSG